MTRHEIGVERVIAHVTKRAKQMGVLPEQMDARVIQRTLDDAHARALLDAAGFDFVIPRKHIPAIVKEVAKRLTETVS
jgi:phage gp36-like protein